MGFERNVGGRDRLARAVLTVVLTVVTIRALQRGQRKTALLTGAAALGVGFNATTGFCGLNETLDIDTTEETDLDERTQRLLESRSELQEATN